MINTSDKRIYVDMDGVICSFLEGVSRITGVELKTHADWTAHRNEGWQAIDALGVDFWENLEWTKDGKDLWNYVTSISTPTILSAHPTHNIEPAIEGKLRWIRNNLGKYYAHRAHILPAVDKQLFAGEDIILIDDSELNIQQWRAKKGLGILHCDTPTSIEVLKSIK